MSWLRPLTALGLVGLLGAGCGASTGASDHIRVAATTTIVDAAPSEAPEAARRTPVWELDPVNPVEWSLIGSWTVTEVSDDAGGVIADSIGYSCDFADEHRLSCRAADGTTTLEGEWLADPIPGSDGSAAVTALFTWRTDDGVDAGTARIIIDGDHVVLARGFDESSWSRTATPARGEQPPAAASRLETELSGSWELVEILDDSSPLIQQLAVGSRCTLAADRTFGCVTGSQALDGTWLVQRGLGGGPNAIAPRLSLTTASGYSIGTTLVLDGPDRMHLTGAAASRWSRVN